MCGLHKEAQGARAGSSHKLPPAQDTCLCSPLEASCTRYSPRLSKVKDIRLPFSTTKYSLLQEGARYSPFPFISSQLLYKVLASALHYKDPLAYRYSYLLSARSYRVLASVFHHNKVQGVQGTCLRCPLHVFSHTRSSPLLSATRYNVTRRLSPLQGTRLHSPRYKVLVFALQGTRYLPPLSTMSLSFPMHFDDTRYSPLRSPLLPPPNRYLAGNITCLSSALQGSLPPGYHLMVQATFRLYRAAVSATAFFLPPLADQRQNYYRAYSPHT